MSLSHLIPSEKELFFKSPTKSSRAGDPRLGDLVTPCSDINSISEHSHCVIGYPDDEGILLNGGRGGAKLAPQTIRKFFYKATPSFLNSHEATIFDLGDLKLESNLMDRHLLVQKTCANVLTKKAKWISLGGGHDYGYPDCAGFLDYCTSNIPTQRPLIINFDAHLDVRPTDQGLTSGTPFFRLLSDYKNFEFIEYGIQTQCNSRSHYAWASAQGATLIPFDKINASPDLSQAKNFISQLDKSRPAFLSIDIDAFSSAYAPGCSQSWLTGLSPNNFFKLYEDLLKNLNVMGIGIYEVSPALDVDNRTSKLAAQIMHRFIYPSSL